MTLLTIKDLRKKYRRRGRKEKAVLPSASQVGAAQADHPHRRGQVFDIFLSHAGLSANEALWLVSELQATGQVVCPDPLAAGRGAHAYATWKEVVPLMQRSRCLLFAARSESDINERFVWLSGYFEAKTGRVAILPVFAKDTATLKFTGKALLGRYPYAGFAEDVVDHEPTVWILKNSKEYVNIQHWLSRYFSGFEAGQ